MVLTYFVSNRDFVLRSTHGHSIRFQKGVPQHVPHLMHSEALERGALPCDEKGQPVDEVVEVKRDPNDIKPAMAPDDQMQIDEAIETAIKLIVERNKPTDFAGPTPSAAAVSALVGFPVGQKDVRKVWEKVRAGLLANK